MDCHQELTDRLERQFCPPLDNSLFFSIVSDFDLTTKDGLQDAETLLCALVEDVEAEEATGFDPSGSGGGGTVGIGEDSRGRSEGGSVPEWNSATDDTSLSKDVSLLGIDETAPRYEPHSKSRETSPKEHIAQWDGLDLGAKEVMLIETFPTAKPFDITWTLKKCQGDMSLAIDELLYQSFLEESGERRKGIDGFSEGDRPARPRKAKSKKKRLNYTSLTDQSALDQSALDQSAAEPSATSVASKWDSGWKDIEFIAERLHMPPQQVSSIYHKNGGSKQATIAAFINAHMEIGLDTQKPVTQRRAQELALQHPTIPLSRLIAIVQLAAPSMTYAEDLASALIKGSPHASGRGTPIQIEFRMAPPDLGENSNSATSYRPSHHQESRHADGGSPYLPASSNELSDLRSQAFASASTAFRKGKSDPLMAAAAGYYSQVGRDLSTRMHASSASEMDKLVSSQSSASMCDLHGVDVKNATRIARERVRGWWGSGRASHAGYTVVTGKGSHSEGGRSRLQPAVAKMLMHEGWRIEVLSGSIMVRGVLGPGKKR